MRVDIDQQDIANALADTRKTFDRAAAGLIVSLSLLVSIFLAAGLSLRRAGQEIAAAAPALSVDELAGAFRAEPSSFYVFAVSLAFMIASVVGMIAVIMARKARAAARKREALAHPLGAGRFEFTFSAENLAITGRLSVKKISWRNIAKIESRKSSIVFHAKDGRYDFIPKNVVPNDNFYDLLMVKHGPLLNKPCPYEEAHLAKPLSVTYEASRADLDDYYGHYFKKRDGKLYPLRRLALWRPWAPFSFLAFAAIAASLGYMAFNTYSLLHAGAAIACALAAGAIFVLNSAYFRGPAHPFRKSGAWPYAQTDLTTVSLTKDGVFHARHGATDFIRWGAFSTYMESKLFGYLVIAPKHAIALPKRAFLDKAHFDDFTAFAKRSMGLAKKQKSDAERGRLTRSIDKKAATAPTPEPEPKPAPKRTSTPAPARPGGPSPKAAPAQVKAAPIQGAAAPKPTPAKPAQQQAGPEKKTPAKAPMQKQARAEEKEKEPSAQTQAILDAALNKAAELDAKAKQAAPAGQPKKKTAAE